ncbi:MAG: hypothetical protein JHC26_11785 [Thermofilum sp.]|uniref:hypothetical protein n=1 Tax=Thermofilum sp. TaxID=1961369 RepID=UPI00258899F7|nr:hypothetical protein [Thermofilum sp.]MCI4409764.1 hypothetical protein [Thermofilum sp.]
MTSEKAEKEGDLTYNTCQLLSYTETLKSIRKQFKENILSKTQWKGNRELGIVDKLIARAGLNLSFVVAGLIFNILDKREGAEVILLDVKGDKEKLEYYYMILNRLKNMIEDVWINLAKHIANEHPDATTVKLMCLTERACEDLEVATDILSGYVKPEKSP